MQVPFPHAPALFPHAPALFPHAPALFPHARALFPPARVPGLREHAPGPAYDFSISEAIHGS